MKKIVMENFDLQRLYSILRATTMQLRKGPVVKEETKGKIKTTFIEAMPHESEVSEKVVEKVDLGLIVVGVWRKKAEEFRDELVEILDNYPGDPPLRDGPNYIFVGGEIGDQGAALQLFALGKYLGFWQIITPDHPLFGFSKEESERMMESGFITISGYKPIRSSELTK